MRSEFCVCVYVCVSVRVCGESDRQRYPISGIASTGAIFQKLFDGMVFREKFRSSGQNEG